MNAHTLTFLINNRNNILYDPPSDNRCGKLWIHDTSFKNLLEILHKVSDKNEIIYEMQHGDIIVTFNGKNRQNAKAIIMYCLFDKKPHIIVADYTIDKNIGIFNNNVLSTQNFKYNYWDII